MNETIINEIKNALIELKVLNLLIDEINPEKEIVYYGIQSVHFIQLIVNLETKYNIEFDDEVLHINKLSTVNKIAMYIEKKLDRGNSI
ncbi:acyl carrier protein [Bacillus cereus]|uniref:acyl carrier protein n=1 Tax=Bacillus cereus TaxID=1396 RepID=UPI003D044113